MDAGMQPPTSVMPKGVLEVCIRENPQKSPQKNKNKKKDHCDSNQCMSGHRATPLAATPRSSEGHVCHGNKQIISTCSHFHQNTIFLVRKPSYVRDTNNMACAFLMGN